MRPRRKKHAAERMERCADYLIENPRELRGRWSEAFGSGAPLRLEAGCGKGSFITGLAARHPEASFVALERERDVILMAMERAAAAGLQNLRFILGDAALLAEYFAPGEVETLYLNFSDPWPKNRHAERRLTHRRFLAVYAEVLAPGGLVRMKTDNAGLFDFSLIELSHAGWELVSATRDLYAELPEDNIPTEYETRFVSLGQPIHSLAARRPDHPSPPHGGGPASPDISGDGSGI